MDHAFRLNGELHEAWLSRGPGGLELRDGRSCVPILVEGQDGPRYALRIDGAPVAAFVAVRGDHVHVQIDGETYTLTYTNSLERFASEAEVGSDSVYRAPMPGSVTSIAVEPGEAVTRGQVLLVIESMKMETAIAASIDGVVHTVDVRQGQTFERDAALVTLTPGKATT